MFSIALTLFPTEVVTQSTMVLQLVFRFRAKEFLVYLEGDGWVCVQELAECDVGMVRMQVGKDTPRDLVA